MKKFFRRLIDFVKNKHQDLFEIFRNNSEVAVKVTHTLKNAVESPVVDIITDIIPGDLDDKIHEKLRLIVPIVAQKLAIAHGILKQNETNSNAITAIVDYLRSPEVNVGVRASFWIMFSGELNKALSDDKMTLAEAVALAQLVYTEIKQK
jgi:ADP-ribosylglycohydrolase